MLLYLVLLKLNLVDILWKMEKCPKNGIFWEIYSLLFYENIIIMSTRRQEISLVLSDGGRIFEYAKRDRFIHILFT